MRDRNLEGRRERWEHVRNCVITKLRYMPESVTKDFRLCSIKVDEVGYGKWTITCPIEYKKNKKVRRTINLFQRCNMELYNKTLVLFI